GWWVHPVGYTLSVARIGIVGWRLTVVAVGVERTLLGRYPDAGLEDRRSRHVRTKIILVMRVTQVAIAAITVAIEPLRREVREGLLTYLQGNYPEALPGGQPRPPSA